MHKDIKNIIFILTDTLRAKNSGLYGKRPSPTPHIDALGNKGVVFMNAYASITKTDPSITSIMSGCYPSFLGLINHGRNIVEGEDRFLPNFTFLPEILQKHGFTTAAIDWLSRWHRRGYDYYSGKLINDIDMLDLLLDKVLPLWQLRLMDKLSSKMLRRSFFSRFYYYFIPNPKIPYDPADLVIDKAIEVLENTKKTKLFLYIHLWDAHFPHTRKDGLVSYFKNTVEDSYNQEIRFMDKQIGRLTSFLKAKDQLDKTLIILTSDHGENLLEYGIPFSHELLYENTVKVPFILRHPILPQKRIQAFAQHVDIMPTVLSLLNLPIPRYVDGKDLTSLIFGKKSQVRKYVYFEDIIRRRFRIIKSIRRRGIRVGRYKYIEKLDSSLEDLSLVPITREDVTIVSSELYDILNDPFEQKNLVRVNPKIANKLKLKLNSILLDLNNKRIHLRRDLRNKVMKSIFTIRRSIGKLENREIAVAWTGGKDSTMLLHLIRLAFNGKIPFRVIFNDSTMEFEEIYAFINKIAKLWNLNLITVKHSKKELDEFQKTTDFAKKRELSRVMKITAINNALKKYKFKAFMVGIRWDEHEARSKETYFSKRKDHVRIHPILHFTEQDIWEYIRFFGVPYVDLYDRGYRSLGEKPFTRQAEPGGVERSGREPDKEQLMTRLRKLGYW